MMQHISINGVPCQHLSVMNRGLHYGDGLFETIACIDGKLQFWDEHIARMRSGAKRLAIDASMIALFEAEVTTLIKQHSVKDCVVKLILTRGQGNRGYRSPSLQKPTRITLLSDLPQYPEEYLSHGIKACLCRHPVSKNSGLAGIKHLNRLDNVLARNEWHDEYQEGIMLDDEGHVIEGTMSNIFSIKNNQLYTPSLNYSGVDGIIRGQILSISKELGLETQVVEINKDELISMDEIFVCNSIIGVWPIKSIQDKSYKIGVTTLRLSKLLQQRMQA